MIRGPSIGVLLCLVATRVTAFSDPPAVEAPSCTDSTSVSLTAVWPGAPPDADIVYLGLFLSGHRGPFALQTVPRGVGESVEAVIVDLLPNTTYTVRWRAHPRYTGRNMGWDWQPYEPPFSCQTQPLRPGAPSGLHRAGNLSETAVTVRWTAAPATTVHSIGVRLVETHQSTTPIDHRSGFAYESVAPTASWATVQRLEPGQSYEVVVVAFSPRLDVDVQSDPYVVRTAAAGHSVGAVRYTELARVSEFTNDVDFLNNHDSATPAALAVLMATWAKQVNVSDDCIADLAAVCQRGHGQDCIDCVHGLSTPPTICGTADVLKYNTNFFCGEGWPSFSTSTPMALYCVENLAAPLPQGPTNAEGWAEYVSCDAQEAGATNHPPNPVCICWCSWDRVAVSNMPASVYNKYCTRGSDGKVVCTCADSLGNGSRFLRPNSTSAIYVSKSSVMLPYIYYTTPADAYPNSTEIGANFGTPKNGSCGESSALGDGGCTWKRAPFARVLYYADLLDNGWRAQLPRDTPTNSSGSRHNIAALAAAADRLSRYISPRCCGC